jgi:hypothetical protein
MGKQDGPKPQTGWSDFPGSSTEGWTLCRSTREQSREDRAEEQVFSHGKAKPDTEKSPEEVVAEQNRIPEVKAETIAEAGSSSRQPPNWIVQFPKPDHSVSSGPGQRGTSRTTTPKIAPPFRLCPPGLTSSQRRRIQ